MWDLSYFFCFESGENCIYLLIFLYIWDFYVGLLWVGKKCLNKFINGEGVIFGIFRKIWWLCILRIFSLKGVEK